MVDLPESLDRRAGERLAAVLSGGTCRGPARRPRVGRPRPPDRTRRRLPDSAPSSTWSPRGTTLITGGTGTLAAHLARWLAGQGAGHIVLTSRRGIEAPGAAELVEELAALGCQVTVEACDVTDRDAVAGLLNGLRADGHTVRTRRAHRRDHRPQPAGGRPPWRRSPRSWTPRPRAPATWTSCSPTRSSTPSCSTPPPPECGAAGITRRTSPPTPTSTRSPRTAARAGARATSISWGIWADDLKLGRVDPSQHPPQRPGLHGPAARR